ncbi:hypothetical protein ACFSRY_03630 [Pontibacter locisalis]|uniref:Outer membrane protein beta-barrel domain-containing protein n=1 Tax=Pontibacter locisalis TaxID=1719035 RepID=A0ABW5IJ45_9BACT
MKTFLLAVAACTLAAFTSYGQTVSADSAATPEFKPQARQFATELNVNPFNGTISLNNSINQLKFRYFTTHNFAVRLGFNGSRISASSENSNPYGTNSYRFSEERSSTTIGVNLGMEKHFAGTKRLSPYVGADIIVENKSASHDITSGQTETNVTGAWRITSYSSGYPPQTIMNFTERGYTRYGLNLVSGFDFYMAKSFFFGYEVNFGFSQTNFHDIEVKQSDMNYNNPDTKNTSFSFGPNLANGFRIGYVF